MRRNKTWIAVVGAAALIGASCGGDDAPRGLDELDAPTFSVDDRGDGEPSSTTSPDSGDGASAPGSSSSVSADEPSGGAGDAIPAAVTERVEFADPVGDATPGIGSGPPPPWTDLAGGALERKLDAYRLVVRLGGAAPSRAPGSATMNIASFYDVDGDGDVDYEIWVNLGSDGWGPVWYDDQGNAAPGEDSNVTVEIEGDEVQLLFPAVMLGTPDRLRFSVASEYGELTTIGSSFARRDDAPDDDRAVSFPA